MAGARQHIRLAGEADLRAAVADIDREVGGARQRLGGGRQPGAQRDGVALAVLQALDAKLFLVGGDGRTVDARHRDERQEIGALARQGFGELETGARRRRIGIDRVVQQPEAVFFTQALELRTDVGHLAQIERVTQRVERGPPDAPFGKGIADNAQRLGLLGRIVRPLISDVARGRRALQQQRALLGVGRADLRHAARQTQPAGGIAGLDGDDLPEQLQAGAEVVLLESLVHLAAQLRHGFRHLPGIGLDLALQPDRGIIEIGARERLVRGLGRGRCLGRGGRHGGDDAGDGEQRGKQAGADGREHGRNPPPRAAGRSLPGPASGQRQKMSRS